MNTPIYNKLRELESEKRIPFHMPGHKRADFGAFFGVEKMDITEITDYDNLHEPEGIIRESMNLVRDIFKSKESWYLVGGSTLGILVSISSVCRQGDKILIGRNCHKAVYNCIRLLQLEAVYCYADVSAEYDICEDMKPEAVARELRANPDIKAVVLTSPTYEGVVSDIAGIKEVTRPYAIPLIVDEAHGAHLIFHKYFPDSAVQEGADLVIQSTHKTLPSFTQTAVLHLCSDIVTKEQVEEIIDIYETSSPSYLLMASAEYGIMYMKENQGQLAEYVDNLKNFRRKCEQLQKISLLNQKKLNCFAYDNGKLVFSVKGCGINGKELFQLLYEKYHIELEMENLTYGIAMTSICDKKEDFDELWKAISEIDKMCEEKEKENLILKTLGKNKDKIPEWTMPEEFIEKQMEIEEEPETPSDALVENTYLSAQTEEEQLSNLLNRLDMAEPIKRMNESAQEDMADVIERDEEKVELSEALPLKPSKSTLPKYQKPKFDFDIQPVSIPLDDQYSNISEYDEVPTIHDLENQWKDDSKPIIETVATSMEEAPQTFNTLEASDTPEAVDFTVPPEDIESEQEVHSEEIVRKNGIGKRSYHKITIR